MLFSPTLRNWNKKEDSNEIGIGKTRRTRLEKKEKLKGRQVKKHTAPRSETGRNTVRRGRLGTWVIPIG